MNEKTDTSLATNVEVKQKNISKLDLIIKYNPSKVSKVCSVCHMNMELELQRPFALFASNGTEPVCRGCGETISPDYVFLRDYYYYGEDEFTELLAKIRSEEEHRIAKIGSKKERRIAKRRDRRRDLLIKEIISKGFTEEQLETIISIPYRRRHSCSENDLPF